MLYFAYGSNLDWNQMRGRCPSARFVSIARLADHRLAFSRKSIGRGCGVADVVAAAGQSVWGVIYEISDVDAASLDRSEGYRAGRRTNAYERVAKDVFVLENGEPRAIQVQTYVANPQPDPPPPNREYLGQLINGAVHWGLPEACVEQLRQCGASAQPAGGGGA